HAASETTQPTALSSAGRGQFLSANPAFWAGAAIEAGSRATACACLRRYVFRESRMSGNLLVRFDEGRVGPPEKVSPSLLLYRLSEKAVETSIRSAMHQAGASALTQLLQYDPPDAEHRTL